MKLEDIRKIGVVGAGTMGHGIALTFALGGYPTTLCDVSDDLLKKAKERIRTDFDVFVDEGMVTRQQAEDAMEKISTTTDLSVLAGDADYICEAIIERAQEKNTLFKKLDTLCPPHTILASNTSSLVLNDFIDGVKRQDKMVLTHYFNPPHIVPCVEVVKGVNTSEETFNLAYDLLEKVRKLPVRVLREMPGYLANRIQTAMMREVVVLWASGAASAEDIDRAVRGSFGFRLASIGPLLSSDLSEMPKEGPTYAAMFDRLFKQISDAKEIPPELRTRWENRQGFFDYPPEKWEEIVKQRDKEFIQRLKHVWKM